MEKELLHKIRAIDGVDHAFTWSDRSTTQNYSTPESRELGDVFAFCIEASGVLSEGAGFGQLTEIHVAGANRSAVLLSVMEAKRGPGDPTTVGVLLNNSQSTEGIAQNVRLLAGAAA
jgi:hypothetical protein